MKSLRSLLGGKIKLAASNQQKKNLGQQEVFYVFKKIIQEDFGTIGLEKLQPEYFSKNTIFIKASHPAWASELWLNRKRIIKKINQEFGEDFLEEIKVK